MGHAGFFETGEWFFFLLLEKAFIRNPSIEETESIYSIPLFFFFFFSLSLSLFLFFFFPPPPILKP